MMYISQLERYLRTEGVVYRQAFLWNGKTLGCGVMIVFWVMCTARKTKCSIMFDNRRCTTKKRNNEISRKKRKSRDRVWNSYKAKKRDNTFCPP